MRIVFDDADCYVNKLIVLTLDNREQKEYVEPKLLLLYYFHSSVVLAVVVVIGFVSSLSKLLSDSEEVANVFIMCVMSLLKNLD